MSDATENTDYKVQPLNSIKDLTNRTFSWGKDEVSSKTQSRWTARTVMPIELHNVVDSPSRLPSFLHPFISNGPMYTPGKGDSPILNFHLEFPNQHDVKRRVWFHLSKENFVVGGICAILIGLGTRNPSIPSRLLYALVHHQAMPKPRLKSVKMTIATFLGRFVIGGLFYDAVKRNHERDSVQFKDDAFNRLKNAGIAGGICGFVFGLRGGIKYAWLASMLHSSGGMLAEFTPNFDAIRKAVEGAT